MYFFQCKNVNHILMICFCMFSLYTNHSINAVPQISPLTSCVTGYTILLHGYHVIYLWLFFDFEKAFDRKLITDLEPVIYYIQSNICAAQIRKNKNKVTSKATLILSIFIIRFITSSLHYYYCFQMKIYLFIDIKQYHETKWSQLIYV